MTIQTAVLIETLIHLGASLRWSSCNIFSTQDHAASAIAAKASRSSPEGRERGGIRLVHRADPARAGGWTPNMILDDGGDATKIIHDRHRTSWPRSAHLGKRHGPRHRLYNGPATAQAPLQRQRQRHQVEFDTSTLPREPVDASSAPPRHGGKRSVVCGFGNVGRARPLACAPGRRVMVTKSIHLRAAGGDGATGHDDDDAAGAPTSASPPRQCRRHHLDHMRQMKDRRSSAHRPLRREIPDRFAAQLSLEEFKPRSTSHLPHGKRLIVLAKGLVNLGLRQPAIRAC